MLFDLDDSLETTFKGTGSLSEVAVSLTDRWSERFFSTSQCPYLLLNPPSVPYDGYQELYHPEVKQLEHEADHSSPSGAGVKNNGAIHPRPRISSLHSA
jgi:hypothetical protein